MKTQNLLILFPLFLATTTTVECRSMSASSINEGRKYTCIVNYLRVKGVIGLEFGTTENTLEPRCISIVESAKAIELKNLKEQLTGEGESDDILAGCIAEELRRNGFEKSALLRFVYEIAPQYNSQQRDDRINDIEAQINREIYKSNILCNSDNSFRGLFDEDEVDESDVKLTPREDYCIRRYIIENDLVKVKGAKLEVIELEKEVDCSKKLVKALLKMENNFLNDFIDENEEDEQLRAIQRDCFLRATHEGDFLKRTLVFDYVKELALTPRQRGQMKNGYVKLLTEFAEKSAECV